MLVFKTKWLLLKIHKTNDKDFLYSIFTQDFGKIICQKKFSTKEKPLDIGYLINFEVETKEERKIHKIRNIKILSQIQHNNTTFWFLNSYLEFINIILKNTPDWVPITQIIPLCETLYRYNILTEEKILLAKLKMYNIFWILPIEHQNKIVTKILKFVNINKFNDVIKLTGIDEEIKKELENIL